MPELYLWMQAWSDEGERILVRVEEVDKVELNTGCGLHGRRLQNVRDSSVPDPAARWRGGWQVLRRHHGAPMMHEMDGSTCCAQSFLMTTTVGAGCG